VFEVMTPTLLDKKDTVYGKVENNDTLSFNWQIKQI
jgi:hypothetical protein